MDTHTHISPQPHVLEHNFLLHLWSKPADSPWSVNSKSVKTQRLNFCFHLSLEENQFHVDVLVMVRCQCLVRHTGKLWLIPSLWGKGMCCFYPLLWTTPGGTASSRLTWRALPLWEHSRDQPGQIRPSNETQQGQKGITNNTDLFEVNIDISWFKNYYILYFSINADSFFNRDPLYIF